MNRGSIGRIPCINPTCSRTAPADKFEGDEVVCYKCWKTLPKRLTVRHKALRRRERKLLTLIGRKISRGDIGADRVERIQRNLWAQIQANWDDIRRSFLEPTMPEGMESFLNEIGL